VAVQPTLSLTTAAFAPVVPPTIALGRAAISSAAGGAQADDVTANSVAKSGRSGFRFGERTADAGNPSGGWKSSTPWGRLSCSFTAEKWRRGSRQAVARERGAHDGSVAEAPSSSNETGSVSMSSSRWHRWEASKVANEKRGAGRELAHGGRASFQPSGPHRTTAHSRAPLLGEHVGAKTDSWTGGDPGVAGRPAAPPGRARRTLVPRSRVSGERW
jgi:hypothetical protein